MDFIPKDSSVFRSAVDALKEFLPQAQVRVNADGLRICGMDVSHVGFVDYFLSAKDCETLVVDGAGLVLGIHTAVLAKVLSNVGSGDKIRICKTKKADKLTISYTNEKVAKKAVYELALIDIEAEPFELPSMNYSASIKAKTSDIHSLIKEVSHFGETATLCLNEDGFHVSTVGDAGKVNLSIENTDEREMSLEGDSVEVSFGMKYLSAIFKNGAPISSTLSVEFDGNMPLRASFHFGSESYFISYLAPKVDNE